MSDLENWLNSERRKPLIVWGTRQVGKSYLIKDIFRGKYFKNSYIYIDFVNFCQNDYNEVNKIYNIHFYAVFLLCEDLKDF